MTLCLTIEELIGTSKSLSL